MQLVLGQFSNKDYDHAAQSNPTVFVHSATNPDTNNTQWGSLAHDQTDFVIATGTGDVKVTSNINLSSSVLEVDGTQVVGAQQAAEADIADTSGTDADGTCRAKLNALMAKLRTHGLIAA